MRDHRKLKTFRLADQLVLAVYQKSRSFPREETFGLTSQVRRAAVSIACNIVEGCARHSELEYLRFLDTAFGSARELRYQLSLAQKLGYLSTAAAHEILPLSDEVCRALYGLITAIRSPDEPDEQERPSAAPQASSLKPQARRLSDESPTVS